ncbi:MAG: flagellar motor switch protein FliN [Spirochaetaceae bacterium]|jgi:flagellar motor switch protein FliN/FliY|nr:flagellar motor switch protein FliN [Spirochaetaceae bacterium]
MSEGALSQAEIDALLSGGDGGDSPAADPGGTDEDAKTLQSFLASSGEGLSASLSQQTSLTISLKGPQVSFTNREAYLELLPDTVTAIKVDYNAGFPGEHMFILPEETARRLAGAMNKEEDIKMDEIAIASIGEMISTLVGGQITALTNKTGNKSIASIPAEASNVPKAVVALPGTNFACAEYQLDLGDGAAQQFWEIFGGAVAESIASALTEKPKPAVPPKNGGMPGMGGMPTGGTGGNTMGSPTNVQSVQFPNLMPHATPQEQGNIGLIMDVFMEMTVELGRTKKLIKEILGMGEGTIIELDKLAGEPVDILVNHKLIAKGEVVVIDENFGVRVTEIVPRAERMNEV